MRFFVAIRLNGHQATKEKVTLIVAACELAPVDSSFSIGVVWAFCRPYSFGVFDEDFAVITQCDMTLHYMLLHVTKRRLAIITAPYGCASIPVLFYTWKHSKNLEIHLPNWCHNKITARKQIGHLGASVHKFQNNNCLLERQHTATEFWWHSNLTFMSTIHSEKWHKVLRIRGSTAKSALQHAIASRNRMKLKYTHLHRQIRPAVHYLLKTMPLCMSICQ